MTTTLQNTASNAHAPSPQAADVPTFVVGSVRSGTTLLRLMLDHHPEIAFHFEFEFAVNQVGPHGELPAIDEYRGYLEQDRIFLLSGGRIDCELSYFNLVDSFLTQRRERAGKPLVGATVHHRFDRLRYLWPNARYVHLVRDGRDVARSCIAMGWAGNMYTGVQRWIDAEECWAELRPHIPKDRRLEIKYELLIADPRGELERVCQFMGVDFNEAMFAYTKTSPYELPDAKLLGQWRRKLTDKDIQLAEARIGDMLLNRGYELSGLAPLEINAGRARFLRWRDRWVRANFRRRRYGTLLFAAEYVARRFGIAPVARRMKRRFDAIDNQHLR